MRPKVDADADADANASRSRHQSRADVGPQQRRSEMSLSAEHALLRQVIHRIFERIDYKKDNKIDKEEVRVPSVPNCGPFRV